MSRSVISLRAHLLFMSHRFLQSQTEPKLRRPRLIVPRIPRIAAACCPHIMQSSPGPRHQQRPSAEFPRVCVSSPRQERPSWASSLGLCAHCSPPAAQPTLILLQLMFGSMWPRARHDCPLVWSLHPLHCSQHRLVAPVSVRAVSKCAVAGPSLQPGPSTSLADSTLK